MRLPFKKTVEKKPVAESAKTPLQELLTAENAVHLAQGEIDAHNKEFLDWARHYGVIEDDNRQFLGVLNESLLSQEVTLFSLRQQFREFQVRKNVLLRQFHEKLASWAQLKQRYPDVGESMNALPMLSPPA
jgi:hypothetical protein